MMNFLFTDWLLAGLGRLMVYMGVRDWQTHIIKNWIVLTVMAGAVAFWIATQTPLWPDLAIRLGVALGVFVLLAIAHRFGMMGGGDVKVAAALTLWFTPSGTVRFLILMSIIGAVVTLVVWLRHKRLKKEGIAEVPYGVAIALAVIWLLTQRFLNHFAG